MSDRATAQALSIWTRLVRKAAEEFERDFPPHHVARSTCSRLTFHASVTSVYSPSALSSPRMDICRQPILIATEPLPLPACLPRVRDSDDRRPPAQQH